MGQPIGPIFKGQKCDKKAGGGSYDGVYIGKSVGSDKFSVAWNQLIGSM